MDVGGDGAADPAVDANDLAEHVEERAAGIAADQRAIGGQGALAVDEQAAEADDRRAAGLVAAGMTDGERPLAEPQIAGGAHLAEGEFPFAGDLDHAAVDVLVVAERLA